MRRGQFTRAFLSKSAKGSVHEAAIDTLTLVLSGGALHPAQMIPDDRRVDRLVYRPADLETRAMQLKGCSAAANGGRYSFTIEAPHEARAAREVLLLACPLTGKSPWIGPDFWALPLEVLGPVPPGGAWSLSVPSDPKATSKYAPFRHPLRELATVLDLALDEGFAAVREGHKACARARALSLPASLSAPARGRVMENEAGNLVAVTSDGRVHLLKPLIDNFGMDFGAVAERAAGVIFLQVKGDFHRGRSDRIEVEVDSRTFWSAAERFILVLEYRADELSHGPFVWLIPTEAFERAAHRVRGNLKFDGSAAPDSRDRWARWRLPAEQLGAAIERQLEASARSR